MPANGRWDLIRRLKVNLFRPESECRVSSRCVTAADSNKRDRTKIKFISP